MLLHRVIEAPVELIECIPEELEWGRQEFGSVLGQLITKAIYPFCWMGLIGAIFIVIIPLGVPLFLIEVTRRAIRGR